MAERETMAFQCVTTRSGGVGFIPAPRFAETAREHFVDGATYWLSVEPERSEKTHNHEFAVVTEAWKTLPESLQADFPTSESLRKRALIECGYYTEELIDAGTQAAALRVAAYVRAKDQFAWVVTRGGVVVVRNAISQSRQAMGAAAFQESKSKILDWIADLIGVEVEQLSRAHAA
jgi:hypothetical protein